MRGIYLASFKALHPHYDIVYQDIDGTRDIGGDMLTIDLTPYDYVIATPPCNWWSRANYRRDSSVYSLSTKLLLVSILYKLALLDKPFLVENVKNEVQFKKYGLYDIPGVYVYKIGRHTYWSNMEIDFSDIIQKPKVDFKNGKKRWLSSQHLARKDRQGGEEVHQVVERFLERVKETGGWLV